MTPEAENAATRWFGASFAHLHPQLQALHRHGGLLCGEVTIVTGAGIGGWIGRRLARRLGLPIDRPRRGFEVRIEHDDVAMRWNRRFDDGSVMRSVFKPVGHHSEGYWLENTGPLRMKLGVDLANGGWRWQLRGVSVLGMPLPLWLFPRSNAYKKIEGDGRYRFGVEFSLFPFGLLLRYEGVLEVCRNRAASKLNDDEPSPGAAGKSTTTTWSL